MTFYAFNPILDLSLREIFPTSSPLLLCLFTISRSSFSCGISLHPRPTRFDHVEIRRVAGPEETEYISVHEYSMLVFGGMTRSFILLYDSIRSLNLTLLGKRNQLGKKDLVLVATPVYTSSAISSQFTCFLSEFLGRSPASRISQTHPSHSCFQFSILFGLCFMLLIESIQILLSGFFFCDGFRSPDMKWTFSVVRKTTPEHELHVLLPSSLCTCSHVSFSGSAPYTIFKSSSSMQHHTYLICPDHIFPILCLPMFVSQTKLQTGLHHRFPKARLFGVLMKSHFVSVRHVEDGRWTEFIITS